MRRLIIDHMHEDDAEEENIKKKVKGTRVHNTLT